MRNIYGCQQALEVAIITYVNYTSMVTVAITMSRIVLLISESVPPCMGSS